MGKAQVDRIWHIDEVISNTDIPTIILWYVPDTKPSDVLRRVWIPSRKIRADPISDSIPVTLGVMAVYIGEVRVAFAIASSGMVVMFMIRVYKQRSTKDLVLGIMT